MAFGLVSEDLEAARSNRNMKGQGDCWVYLTWLPLE